MPLYRPRYPPPRRVKQGLVMRRQDFRSVENYFIFCMQLCKKQWLCAEFKPGIATGRSCAVKTARENRRCGNTPCSVKKSLILLLLRQSRKNVGMFFPEYTYMFDPPPVWIRIFHGKKSLSQTDMVTEVIYVSPACPEHFTDRTRFFGYTYLFRQLPYGRVCLSV